MPLESKPLLPAPREIKRQLENKTEKGKKNMGVLWLVLILVAWVALQAYILPKMGIST